LSEVRVAAILVSGAGQLGTRYLQGIAKYRRPLRLYVHDVLEQSLVRAEERWKEARCPEFSQVISFHRSLESLPPHLDLAIVTTTADVRPRVTGQIASHAAVRYWVLEKILAQNESGIAELESHTRNATNAWVNTPRRMMRWHQEIKLKLPPRQPLVLEITGGQWGLACNAIHFLDLLAWWTGERLEYVSTEHLGPQWFASKRPGFLEVSGTLEARFSGGSRALLSAEENGGPVSMALAERNASWVIDEATGLARRSDGTEIPGRIPYQSEMTAHLVESILERGRSDLPTFEDSAGIHRVFLRSMHRHWQRAHPAATAVPIT
jgi:hypothetical protein